MGASATLLAAAGMPIEQAKLAGETFGALTLTGTSQATAAALPAGTSVVTVTAAASQTGGILPTHNVGRTLEVVNTSGTGAVIYPPVGGTINGNAANAGTTVAANKSAIFRCITNTAGVSTYHAIVSA